MPPRRRPDPPALGPGTGLRRCRASRHSHPDAGGRTMGTIRRIGILTGGGDVPGLNVAIKAVAGRAQDHGIEVVGLRRGWASVLDIDPADPATVAQYTMRSHTRRRCARIDRSGGTMLHSSRTNPSRVKAGRRARAHRAHDDRTDARRRQGRLHRARRARHRAPGPRRHRPHRRRRHAELRRPAAPRGRPGGGDPQDDGQRRLGHRLLHRLLDRDHAFASS